MNSYVKQRHISYLENNTNATLHSRNEILINGGSIIKSWSNAVDL